MKIITGNTGMKHVTSDDDGAMYASIIGKQDYIFDLNDNFSHEILDTNTIKINSGDALLNGRHVRIPRGSYDLVTIDNGQTGYKRIDLITIRYESNGEIERAYLNVIKGTQTTGTATLPSYEKGSILDGTLVHDLPLYEVHLNGINLDKVKAVFVAKDLSTTHLGYRPNLLINGDFRNPINQRGQTSYTLDASARKYTIDRWCSANAIKVVLEDDGIRIYNTGSQTYGYLLQYIETPLIVGEKYTISAKINGVIRSHTFIAGEGFNMAVPYFTYDPASDSLAYDRIGLRIEDSYLVEYIKLEQGSIATPFVPRPYAEELALCKRYFDVVDMMYVVGFSNSSGTELRHSVRTNLRIKPTVVNFTQSNTNWHEIGSYNNSVTIGSVQVSQAYPEINGMLCIILKPTTALTGSSVSAPRVAVMIYLDAEIY